MSTRTLCSRDERDAEERPGVALAAGTATRAAATAQTTRRAILARLGNSQACFFCLPFCVVCAKFNVLCFNIGEDFFFRSIRFANQPTGNGYTTTGIQHVYNGP